MRAAGLLSSASSLLFSSLISYLYRNLTNLTRRGVVPGSDSSLCGQFRQRNLTSGQLTRPRCRITKRVNVKHLRPHTERICAQMPDLGAPTLEGLADRGRLARLVRDRSSPRSRSRRPSVWRDMARLSPIRLACRSATPCATTGSEIHIVAVDPADGSNPWTTNSDLAAPSPGQGVSRGITLNRREVRLARANRSPHEFRNWSTGSDSCCVPPWAPSA